MGDSGAGHGPVAQRLGAAARCPAGAGLLWMFVKAAAVAAETAAGTDWMPAGEVETWTHCERACFHTMIGCSNSEVRQV